MHLELLNPANYSFNPHAIPNILTAVAVVSLGFIVLIGENRSRVGASFFVMTATAATWLFSYSIMYCALTEKVAAAWAFIGQFGVTLIPAAVYHFTVGTLQIYPRHKSRVWLTWLVAGAFLLTVLSGDTFLDGVYHYWWGYYAKYAWMSALFLGFFFALMALSLRHYWLEYHGAAAAVAKKRSKALFIAFCVAYLGSFDYLPALGVGLYPFGYLPVLGFIILTARAVWRYRLVDITPASAANEIINAMADALLVMDNEGFVRVANGAACRLFHQTEDELVGSHIRDLTPALAAPDIGLDRLIVSSSLRDFESVLPGARDGITTVSISSFPMRDDEIRPVAFVCIVRDITQQKKAQQEIERHTKEQTALYEQTRKQALDLEKANRVKDEFLSVMSHELRTPLNVIAGYTRIVQDGLLGEINPEQVNALDKVSRHTNELLVMVNSIMDATKIEAGSVAIECDEFSLAGFIDALKILYEYPLGKNVALKWDYAPNLPVIRTDRDKLKHIIQNLINNALKFTDEGQVTVAARHIAGKDRVELSVTDTGIGIAAEELRLVFGRFRQVDSSRTRSHGGVGIGLHIVKTFTEILGGTVSATSEPGRGSTFIVTLPCVYEGGGTVKTNPPRPPTLKPWP